MTFSDAVGVFRASLPINGEKIIPNRIMQSRTVTTEKLLLTTVNVISMYDCDHNHEADQVCIHLALRSHPSVHFLTYEMLFKNWGVNAFWMSLEWIKNCWELRWVTSYISSWKKSLIIIKATVVLSENEELHQED